MEELEELLSKIEIQNHCMVSEEYGLDNTYFYVLCPYGIGDTLYVAMMIKAYCEEKKVSKPVCFIVKENHAAIPRWFFGIDSMIALNALVDLLDIWAVQNSFFQGDNFLYGHFPKNQEWELVPEYANAKEKNMIYRYRTIVMHISENAVLEIPRIPRLSEKEVEFVYGIGKNTIIMMPYAASSAMVPMAFWEYMAGIFQKLGYKVLTNVKDNTEEPIKGTLSISENLERMVSLCEASAAVISMRSGICDILAQTKTDLIILNTTEYLYNEWDIKYATERQNILSLLYDSDDKAMEVVKEILQFFHISI